MIQIERGDLSRAQVNLAQAIDGGGDLFVVDMAIERYRDLFPNDPAPERHRTREGLSRSLAESMIHLARFLSLPFASPTRGVVSVALALVVVALSPRKVGDFDRSSSAFLGPDEHGNSEQRTRVLESQPAQLDTALAALAPQRPDVADVYFVGFAGWGAQDVFRNEVRSYEALFALRPATGPRTFLLVNDDEAPSRAPIASLANLQVVLRRVGATMDGDDDVLFLMMTSHGSREALGVSLLDAPLTSIEPRQLRDALDASGIRWRILIVSGCESGTFIEPLRDDHTLVATAAASDRYSFGCGSGRPFTEYGKAVFDELARRGPIVDGFQRAMQRVAEREKAEGFTQSLPQLAVGKAIEKKLHEME